MKGKDLKALSIIELRKLAKQLHVSLKRTMTKQQLVKAIVASTRSRAISATLKKRKQPSGKIHHPPAAGRHAALGPRYEEILPAYSGITKLVLMPRDPWWIFAYWEIDRSQLGKKDLILRVYRKDNQLYASISIGDANNWYINLPEPGETARSEIGFIRADGEFKVVAVSNTVRTPRAWPSHTGYEEAMHGFSHTTPFTESYEAFEKSNPYIREDITSRKR